MDVNQIITGDALEMLSKLPDASIQCCITSPPYYGLRDYDVKGQIGLEASPDEYVARLVAVFREVRRVLRTDGTLWVNLGDSYANDTKWGGSTGGKHVEELHGDNATRHRRHTGLKPKDLIGIPWMTAFALRTDGWYLRSDIIWNKPTAMPESVTDRPTKAHEYLFLFAKNERYFYDAEAIREENSPTSAGNRKVFRGNGVYTNNQSFNNSSAVPVTMVSGMANEWTGRNKRTVWTVASQPFSEAHFATFPPKLIEPCILAGTSPRACEHCLAPWERVTERIQFGKAHSDTRYTDEKMQATRLSGSRQAYRAMGLEGPPAPITTGWQPTCTCPSEGTGKCIVLDPFMGAGTTALVAIQHGRNYLGIELNPSYVQLAEKRIATVQQNLWSTSGSEAMAV